MLVPMEKRHADEVGKLHYLHVGSFLKDLGENMCICFYKNVLESDSNFGFVYTEGDRVQGFIFGTLDNSKLFMHLRVRLTLLLALLKKPWLMRRVLCRYRKEFPPFPERCYMATAKQIRGKGIGRLLNLKLHEEFKNRGVSTYQMRIDADNKASLGVTQKVLGGIIMDEFEDNGKRRYRLEVTT